MKRQLSIAVATAGILVSAVHGLHAEPGGRFRSGALYTMSNSALGNHVLMFDRRPDGGLEAAGAVATGGNGSGGGLGNQGGVVLTRNEQWLLAVNAGSDSVSVFEVRQRGLALKDVEGSGGQRPISVTAHGNLVYVLNALSDSIAGFTLTRQGQLVPIQGATGLLSGAGTDPAQIAFTPDGRRLVVTEKATSKIVSFDVDREGRIGPPQVDNSNGATPFGFAVGKRDQLFVSEAFGGAPDASALSSYRFADDGSLDTISPSVGTTETAACWVALTPDGQFAYVTDTGSATVSGYSVDFDGTLQLLDADGHSGTTGAGPIDLALTDNGRFLYTLNSGANTISAFRINAHDGALTPIGEVPGLPAGANGLALR